jgi:hypothetical protein
VKTKSDGKEGFFFFFKVFSSHFGIFNTLGFLFDFHSCIWKTFRVRSLRLHLSTSLSSHFQRRDESCLCEGYRLNSVLGELRAYQPNNYIQIFARWSSNFIRCNRGQQFSSAPIPSSSKTFYLHLLKLPSYHLSNY